MSDRARARNRRRPDRSASEGRTPLLEAFTSLASRRIVLFTGKGGVGKTTISSLAALHYSAKQPTILFTTDPASNLRDLFDGRTEIENLRIESLDAEKLYAGFLQKNLEAFLEIGDRGTYLDREELKRFFELSLPGVDEVMAWMHIGELAEENAESMIVVDTAPTGHALRMLGAAEHFRQLAAALDAMEEKHRGMMRQFTRRDVRDDIDAFINQFEADARRRRELLTDSKMSALVPVMMSEPWVVDQTLRLTEEVRAIGIDMPFAILNRAVLEPDCGRDRAGAARDAQARRSLAPLPVVDARRSCLPLDSVEALKKYFKGERAGPAANEIRKARTSARLTVKSKLLFLAGKGGVGKTTCASSIALQLATAHPERRYTIISVDPAHALRDVFAHEAAPHNLTVEMIDTREKWRRLRETIGSEIQRAIDALTPGRFTVAYDGEAMRKLIDIAPPGADELFAITRLAELSADERQDVVIVDTAPTGHFLRLLELPRTAGDWVREFIRILLRYRDLVSPGSLGEELVNASRSLNLLNETLHSNNASVIAVTRPERVVVAETQRLIDELERRGINVAAVVANYVTPENDCACDASMRSFENKVLDELDRDLVVIERRDAAVTTLNDLRELVPLQHGAK